MNPLKGWIDFLKRQKARAEDSTSFRAAVALLVLVALLAVCHQLEWPAYGWVAIGLTLPGFLFSHFRRRENNWWVKAILSILMLMTLFNFFRSLAQTLWDPRIPLAELLIWLQTLHSWDLPARKDLNYSMLVALILISMGAVLTTLMTYLAYLSLFVILAVTAIHYDHLSRLRQLTGLELLHLEPRPPQLAGQIGRSLAALLLVGGLALAMMPRYESMRLRTLPVSWQQRLEMTPLSQGQVVNPSYPNGVRDPQGGRASFSADNYHGFNTSVDLNMRGRLDDSVVMKVRTSRFTYYRGLTFDIYDGHFWTQKIHDFEELTAAEPPIMIPRNDSGRREKVQIFYVEKRLPNIIFAGLNPHQLYFPSTSIYAVPAVPRRRIRDYTGGLRSPFALEPGTVYSVISYEPTLGPDALRRLPQRDPVLKAYQQYLQLPDELPERTRQLALELTRQADSSWGKATAIAGYLQNHYTYSLDIPRYPDQADTADYFLFESKAGYCEQFATAMVVLCRAAGLRARYVNGYLPGTYNPLTGFYEVKGTDAHAWVEVFIPSLGWLTFDPTPGATVTPELGDNQARGWLILSLLAYLGIGRQAALWVCLAAGLLGSGWLLLQWRPRSRPDPTPQGQIRALYQRALESLAKHGHSRLPGQTPRAFLAENPWPGLERLTQLFEQASWGSQLPSSQEVEGARAALASLKSELRQAGRQDTAS